MILILIQSCSAGLMTALGVWSARRSRMLATLLSMAMAGMIVLKAVIGHVPAAEPSLFPWDWYPYAEPWWYMVPALFLLGAGLVIVWGSRLKRDLLLVGAGLLIARTAAAGWLITRPHKLTGKVNDAGVCLQSSGYSCAAAAAASFLYYYGIPATEQEMADLCVTRGGGASLAGTSDAGVLRGLRRKLDGKMTVQIARLSYEEVSTPALVPIEVYPGVGHCILLWRVDPELVHVVDPRCGRMTLSRSTFERMWSGSAIWAE